MTDVTKQPSFEEVSEPAMNHYLLRNVSEPYAAGSSQCAWVRSLTFCIPEAQSSCLSRSFAFYTHE